MSEFSGCDSCSNYVYNEDFEYYECLVGRDEDEYAKFIALFERPEFKMYRKTTTAKRATTTIAIRIIVC